MEPTGTPTVSSGELADGKCHRLNNWLKSDSLDYRENLIYRINGESWDRGETVYFQVIFEAPLNVALTDSGFVRFQYDSLAAGFNIVEGFHIPKATVNFDDNTVDVHYPPISAGQNDIIVNLMQIRLVKSFIRLLIRLTDNIIIVKN